MTSMRFDRATLDERTVVRGPGIIIIKRRLVHSIEPASRAKWLRPHTFAQHAGQTPQSDAAHGGTTRMVDSDHEIDAGVLVFQRLSQAAPQGTPLVDLVLWTICEVTLRHEPHNDGSELKRYDAIDGTALRRATHREHPATATGSLASSRSCRSSQQGTASLDADQYV